MVIWTLVDLSDLKLFKDIAQARSISRGARQCGISQSAASQHVREVERKLGLLLFDRSTRPLELTAAGRLYYELCRDVLRREAQFRDELDTMKGQVEGTVRVASIYSVGLSEMTRLQAEFAARFPKAHLHVDYGRPERVYAAVAADEVDLGLVSYPVTSRQLAVITWREEEMRVAVALSHPLAGREAVRPADLEGCDFVGFDPELPIRREVDRFLREQGVTVNLVMHFDNIQMIKEAVALGAGMAILPARTMLADVEQGRIASVPLGAPGLVRPLGIIYRKRKKFNPAVESFLKLLQEQPAEEPTPVHA